MDETIGYRHITLDLTPGDDLTALAAVFAAQGIPPLHVTHGEEGLRQATFETYEQPEPPITAMITVIDVRAEPLRTGWAGCTRREFNIGYAYGCRLWVFTQGLSSQRLGRMAAADASLRITLYPPGRDKTAEPGAAADARQRSRR